MAKTKTKKTSETYRELSEQVRQLSPQEAKDCYIRELSYIEGRVVEQEQREKQAKRAIRAAVILGGITVIAARKKIKKLIQKQREKKKVEEETKLDEGIE